MILKKHWARKKYQVVRLQILWLKRKSNLMRTEQFWSNKFLILNKEKSNKNKNLQSWTRRTCNSTTNITNLDNKMVVALLSGIDKAK